MTNEAFPGRWHRKTGQTFAQRHPTVVWPIFLSSLADGRSESYFHLSTEHHLFLLIFNQVTSTPPLFSRLCCLFVCFSAGLLRFSSAFFLINRLMWSIFSSQLPPHPPLHSNLQFPWLCSGVMGLCYRSVSYCRVSDPACVAKQSTCMCDAADLTIESSASAGLALLHVSYLLVVDSMFQNGTNCTWHFNVCLVLRLGG